MLNVIPMLIILFIPSVQVDPNVLLTSPSYSDLHLAAWSTSSYIWLFTLVTPESQLPCVCQLWSWSWDQADKANCPVSRERYMVLHVIYKQNAAKNVMVWTNVHGMATIYTWTRPWDSFICYYYLLFNSSGASRDNWCTGTLWNRIITAQCEGMGEVGSARYEPALLPPCPSIRVLSYSNCQRSSHSMSK